MRSFIILILFIFLFSCHEAEKPLSPVKKDYIKKIDGKDDPIDLVDIRRGEVLIAYSDCYECHARDNRAKGPAFSDIAKRYPVNNGYIKLLALRVINGGNGAWGNSVMLPHPKLSPAEAGTMVKFILSLDQ